MKTLQISNIEPIKVAGGALSWRPVRRTLGIGAFGVNAYTADEGHEVVETHDETGFGAGHHEELYVVVSGRATFSVDGQMLDAPAGTLVFLDDPAEKRGAVAAEDGTTVLAIGGTRGEPFQVSPWEFAFAAVPAIEHKRWDDAIAMLRDGLERHPDNPSLLYDLACVEAQAGVTDAALEHLAAAVAAEPKYRRHAAEDEDLTSLRGDARFQEVVT
jgi:tetratricopeptide (TPR) repeat protein